MSIIPQGTTGYADYQRNTAADGPLLFQCPTTIGGPVYSGLLPVGQYWGLSSVIGTVINPANITYTWYYESGETVEAGSRIVYFGGFYSSYTPLILPNLGPYVQVSVGSPNASYPLGVSVTVLGTNRSGSILTPGPPDLLINQQAATVNGNTTNFYYPSQGFAGPAQMYVTGNAAAQFVFEVWNGTAWETFYQGGLAAGTEFYQALSLPVSSWRAGIYNATGGVGTYTLAVMPAFTGST